MFEDITLLDHQAEFVEDDYTRHLLLLAGYGAGKTFGFIAKAYDLASKNVGYTGILLEPTAPLLHDILIPDTLAFLEKYDIEHTFVKSPQPNLTIKFETGTTKILMRSLENWQRLIGVNAAFIGTDEMDTVKKEIVLLAYKKLQGRLRQGNTRQMFNATTPEGFSGAYELFEQMNMGKIIRAKTIDNPFLPKDFIDDLKSSYSPELIKAYMNGEFVNLASGTVYSYFDRKKHHSDREIQESDVLHVGQDFNYGGAVSTVHVIDGGVVTRVAEHTSLDTPTVVLTLKKFYPNHKIVVYPDASGNSKSTNASETDIQMLRKAQFSIESPASNGAIKDRVNSVQTLLSQDRYLVNTSNCPDGTRALEQQAWDIKTQSPEKFVGGATLDDYNDSMGYFVARKFPIRGNRLRTYRR